MAGRHGGVSSATSQDVSDTPPCQEEAMTRAEYEACTERVATWHRLQACMARMTVARQKAQASSRKRAAPSPAPVHLDYYAHSHAFYNQHFGVVDGSLWWMPRGKISRLSQPSTKLAPSAPRMHKSGHRPDLVCMLVLVFPWFSMQTQGAAAKCCMNVPPPPHALPPRDPR